MNKNIKKAALRMQKRGQHLGLSLTVDQAMELLAAAEGFRNRHAWTAYNDKLEKPALLQEHPEQSNCDYRLVEGRGCWISMAGFSVHPYLTDEGVVVDIYAKGAEDTTLSSTYASSDEAEYQLAEYHGFELDDALAWAEQELGTKFDSAGQAARFGFLERYAKLKQDTPDSQVAKP